MKSGNETSVKNYECVGIEIFISIFSALSLIVWLSLQWFYLHHHHPHYGSQRKKRTILRLIDVFDDEDQFSHESETGISL